MNISTLNVANISIFNIHTNYLVQARKDNRVRLQANRSAQPTSPDTYNTGKKIFIFKFSLKTTVTKRPGNTPS